MKRKTLLIAGLIGLLLMLALPVIAGQSAEGKSAHGFDPTIPISTFVVGTVVNASTLIGLQKTFKALYRQTYDAIEPSWQKVATEVTSTNASEDYQWLGSVPAMKEWVDEKVIEKLRGFGYTIKNKDWESTLEVDRNHIEDDQLGLYRPRIMELADEAKRHPDELVSTLRKNGGATLCYDGQYFYDTDHVIGKSGSLSNLLTGTGVTAAQFTADFRAARAALRKFKNDQGKPFVRRTGRLDLIVTIPPDMEGVVEEVANASFISNTENVLKGAFQYLVDPYLTDVNDWYLDYAGAPIKPFLFQNRKSPDFVALDNPNASEIVFMQKKLLFGVEARYNAGYGLWQYSIKTTNT